jgi:DNA-binding transcriptional LysR family regulator
MELNHLQTFIVVAEEKSITQAAKRLFTTASSISVQIKALEDELGVQLFIRTARGMQITEKGQTLLLKAQQTIASVRDLVNHASEIRAYLMGEIALGLNAPPNYLRLPPLIQKMREETAGITLLLHHLASGRVIEQLLSEALDMGFVFGAVNDARLSSHFLTQADLVIASPAAWNLEQADWKELSKQPWICSDYYCPFQEIIDEAFQAEGLSYPKALQSRDELSKTDYVMAGLGLALLEKTEAEAYAATGKLKIVQGIQFSTELSIVCLSYRLHDPLIEAVLEMLTDLWQESSA